MPTVSLSPLFNGWQGFTSGGIPLSGGLLNTYLAGTSTPATTYTSNLGTIPNSNPIVLDGGGRPPSEIWQVTGQSYRYVLTDSTGANPLTYDNIAGIGDVAAAGAAAALAAFAAQLADTTNTSNGDALVGVKSTYTGTVGRTQHNKNQETISIADFLPAGYVTDGSVDYTTQVQAFFTACATNYVRGLLLPIDIQISSTISLTSGSNLSNFEIAGESSVGMLQSNGAYGCRFLWSGAGGTAFSFNNIRDAKIGGFFLMPKTANNIAVGIDIDGTNSTNLDFNVSIHKGSGSITTGIRISNTAVSGCDIHNFDHCSIYGATTGVDIRAGQSKFHNFNLCTFAACTTGINQVAGSFTAYRPNFSANGVDIALAQVGDDIAIYNPQSELSGRFLYAPNAYSSSQPFSVFGGRLQTSTAALNADGKYIVYSHGGGLNLFGVTFEGGTYVAAWKISANNVSSPTDLASVTAIGCSFPNQTLWDNADTHGIYMVGCKGLTSGAAYVQLANVEAAGLYSTAVGTVYAPAIITLAAGATTVNAALGGDFITSANAGATAITAISNARVGQVITICGGSSTFATTIADAGNFKLSAAVTLNLDTTITLKTYDGTVFREICRSVN